MTKGLDELLHERPVDRVEVDAHTRRMLKKSAPTDFESCAKHPT